MAEQGARRKPAVPSGRVMLDVGSADGEDPKNNLSAATRIGDSLFLAGDEMAVVERLTRQPNGRWGAQTRYSLSSLLHLNEPDEEVDIEGLSAEDGWLWVVGSHARTRHKPEKSKGRQIDLAKLADLRDTRPRCVLARLPLVASADHPGTYEPVRKDGVRRAGLIRQTKRGSKLAVLLQSDPLLAPFTRIPAKEGGVDIEGICVSGSRIALGMRGPVIATHALLLEIGIEVSKNGRLKLAGGLAKRLLDLDGLGIRDLKRRGNDLLILAGPTTSLDGPCTLYRWRDWVLDPADGTQIVELHTPERLLDLPFGYGVDHPEGLALWDGDEGDAILVLCDAPAPERFADGAFVADLFDLPD